MRKIVLRCFILAVILTVLSTGIHSAAAQEETTTPDAAFAAALQAYNSAQAKTYAFTEMRQENGLAYAIAAPAVDASEYEYAVLLAEAQPANGWRVLIPGHISAPEYNALLERFPDSLLDEGLRARFLQPDNAPIPGSTGAPEVLMAANFTGHRLPWPYKTTAYVTQKDNADNSHMNQIDFDIGGYAVPNGDIYATRPGKVVFVKDSSNTTCRVWTTECTRAANMIVIEHGPAEYSWYLHIAYKSATVTTGQQVGYGTKIAVEGDTGFSTAVHLHYMGSTGHTTWTDPNNPNASPWGLGITAVDFDEYSWAALVPTYKSVYTSQNGASLPPVCPAAGGALLYRDSGYGCGGLLENSGYAFRGEAGFQTLTGLNEQASSARVPQGWSLLLHENNDRSGGKKCLNESDNNFAGDTFDNSMVLLDNRVSSFEVFNTPGCPARPPADLTAPTGALTSPAAGATVGRSMSLTSNAADNQSGIQSVQFTAKWGGATQIIYTDTSAPYSYTWDACASGVPDGSLELGQIVTDHAWNVLSSTPVTVTKAFDCAAAPAGTWSVDYFANPNLSGAPALHTEHAATLLFHNWGSSSPDSSLPADGWSARYTRAFNFTSGEYRFHCQSAGGCRVLVDGQARIDAWQEAADASNDWTGSLPEGSHTITVEFFDASGEARLEAWWQGAGFLPRDAACTAGQWCAEIWGNPDLRGRAAVWRDEGETLRRSWNTSGPYPMLPGDNFSARYKRQVYFDCGTYRFTVTADGPARMIIDGTARINQWTEPTQTTSYTVDLALTRGLHEITAEYADLNGTAGLTVAWERQSSCAAAVSIESVSTHIARPNTGFEPRVQARVTSGYLNPARGDGLVFASGSGMGAGPGLVRQAVETGQSYIFDSSNGFQMTAPAANGTHSGQWRVQAGGSAASSPVNIQVMVDGSPPQLSISAPTGMMTGSNIQIQAAASDAHTGVSHVQFIVGANFGSGWAWQTIGWDTTGSDGWSINWDPGSIADQNGIIFLAAAWDKAGNYSETRTGGLTLDRGLPTASIIGPGAVQDSTRFLVQWSGSDSFSGLHHFDVQVRIDGGAPQNWMMNTAPTTQSAWYVGEMGRKYAFQVRAVDKAGNASAYTAPSPETLVQPCSPDAFEPDNTSAQAQAVLADTNSEVRSLCGTGDLDWYVFEARAGELYMFQTRGLGDTTDTILSLYAADGQTKLAENDQPYNPASVVLWKAEVDGPLYFSVRHTDSRVAGSAVTYTVRAGPVIQFFLPGIFR